MQLSCGARRALTAVVGTGLALAVATGCGFKTQTNEVYQPAVGTDARDGRVDVLGNVIVAADQGTGVLVTTLVNNDLSTADKLQSVTGADGTTVTLDDPIDIPAGGSVNLADDGGLPVSGDAVDPTTSAFVTLTYTFENADPVTVGMPVVRPDGPYADFTPQPSASPSGKASSSASPSASPSS